MRLHFKEDENEDYMPIEEDSDLLDDILVLVDEDLEVIEEDDLAEYGKDPNEENTIEETEDISWANNNLLNKQEDKKEDLKKKSNSKKKKKKTKEPLEEEFILINNYQELANNFRPLDANMERKITPYLKNGYLIISAGKRGSSNNMNATYILKDMLKEYKLSYIPIYTKEGNQPRFITTNDIRVADVSYLVFPMWSNSKNVPLDKICENPKMVGEVKSYGDLAKFATDMETMLKLDGYLLAKTPNNPILVFEGLNEQMKGQSLSNQIITYTLIRHSDFWGRSLCLFLNPLPTNKDVFYRRMYMEGELLI